MGQRLHLRPALQVKGKPRGKLRLRNEVRVLLAAGRLEPDDADPYDGIDDAEVGIDIDPDGLPADFEERRVGGALPWELPRAVRLPVLYRLQVDGTLTGLSSTAAAREVEGQISRDERPEGSLPAPAELVRFRDDLACKLARHVLDAWGEQGCDTWRRVPWAGLQKTFVEDIDPAGLVKEVPEVLDFAIQLPDGAVVAPRTFTTGVKGKRATEGAVLRGRADGELLLPPGDSWTPEDEARLRDRERKQRRRLAARRSGEDGA